MIVLDTDVCIALLRGSKRIIDRRTATSEPVATTAVTVGELRYGAEKSANPNANQALVTIFLRTLPVFELSTAAAARFGEIKARLERTGQRLDDADIWIAAISIQQGASLATGNTRHYRRISELVLEDWLHSAV